MATILTSSQQTFVDITDQRKLSAYITSNLPKTQSEDPNVLPHTYAPSWDSTNLVLTPVLFLDDLKRVFLTMMNKLRFGNDLILKPLLISITTSNSKKNIHSMEDIEKDMQSNEEQRKQLNTLLTRGYLERPVFAEAHNKLIMEYEQLAAKRDLLYRMDNAGYTMEQALSDMVSFLNGAEPFTEWDDSLFERFVEKVKVLSREEVEFVEMK